MIPACGASHINAGLFILDDVAAPIELSQDSCRETFDIARAAAVCQEPALETDPALGNIVSVASLLPDDDLAGIRLRVSGDETLLPRYRYHLRNDLVFLI